MEGHRFGKVRIVLNDETIQKESNGFGWILMLMLNGLFARQLIFIVRVFYKNVTNLTRMDFPRKYGELELDRLIMNPGGAIP